MTVKQSIRGGKARIFVQIDGAGSETEIPFTTGPLELTGGKSLEPVECNEFEAPIIGLPNKKSCKLTFECLDTRLSMLSKFLSDYNYNQGSQTMEDRDGTPATVKLRLEWPKLDTTVTVCSLTIYRAQRDGDMTMSFEKGKPRSAKVEFMGYADPENGGRTHLFNDNATPTA